MSNKAIEERVRAQYEMFPYPLRDPGELFGSSDLMPLESLRFVTHFGRAGRPLGRPPRILVAGGGTGDATVQLGAQLGDGATLVHLDLSEAAVAIAAQRAEHAGVKNVTFQVGSLLDADPGTLGLFDYINCSGVLHHLPDPWAGVQVLRRLLTPEGVLGVMVYGPHGRHGLYPTQDLLRRLTQGYNLSDKVEIARRVLRQLPKQHPLRHNGLVGYSETCSDTELVDRYLHPCDRAFTVPEAIAWMGDCGMRIIDFVPSIRYQAALLVADPWILDRLAHLPLFERYAVAELWSFHLGRHSFFAVRDDNETAPLSPGPDVVPDLVHHEKTRHMLTMEKRLRWHVGKAAFQVPFDPTPLHLRVLDALDDRTLGATARALGVTWERFLDVFMDLYVPLHGAGFLLLRDPS